MSFRDIKGQPFAVKLLKRALDANRLAGTYLFYGPQGVGKEFTAREFAKALNCTEQAGDNCGDCSSCARIEHNTHPDVSWVYPIGKGRQIKIEQVRQLQKFVSLKPYEGKTKVCIIVDAHTLNIESGNALLKTLEEPPPNSVFVLVTDSPETLLPTIKSRTQDVQFFYLTQDEIAELLENKIGFSKKEAYLYAQLGMGSLSRSLSFKDEDIFNQRKLILDVLAEGSFKNIKILMDKVGEIQNMLDSFKESLQERLNKENDDSDLQDESSPFRKGLDEDAFIAGEYRKQAGEILGLILSWYRDILIYRNANKEELVLNKDYIDRIKYWAGKLNTEELCSKIDIVDDIREALARQVNLKLLLQVMFIQLGFI